MLESIKDGKEISNDVYEKLILHKIKRTFPCLTNEEFIEEYFKNETYKPEDSKEEKEENKEDSSVKTKKEREYVEIMKSPFKFTKGWLLLDYPLNYQQAQDLEKGLTNFLTYDDRTIPEGEILKKNANTLAKSTPKIIAKKKLIRSGIDCVCVVQVDKDSCLKRAFGRRIDPENNDIYHLDENPPPTDDSSKVEKLECYDDPYNSELSIMDKHCTFDDNKFLMK